MVPDRPQSERIRAPMKFSRGATGGVIIIACTPCKCLIIFQVCKLIGTFFCLRSRLFVGTTAAGGSS